MAVPRLGVAPLLALRHGTRKYMALARCCVAELGDEIGTGSTTQVVLPQDRIEAGFEALRERWQERRPGS